MPGTLGRVALGLLFLSCISHHPQIIKGHYRGVVKPIMPLSPDDSIVNQLRSTLTPEEDSLKQLASRLFILETGIEFSFSYAAASDNRFILLRYFAPLPTPTLIAGYSCQLLFDRAHRRLVKIFVERIPLE